MQINSNKRFINTKDDRVVYLFFPLVLLLAGAYLILYYYEIGPRWMMRCLFKEVSSLACPSCGTTRSLSLIYQREFFLALRINFIGYIAALALIILPCWIVSDIVRQRKTLSICYGKAQLILRKKKVYIPLLILVLAQWIWGNYIGN